MYFDRKTKIICTLGPSSNTKEVIRDLLYAGMNVARLNFSHGDHTTHKQMIDMISEVREKEGLPLAIMLDTKGPEIRTKSLVKDEVMLETGKTFVLTVDENFVGDEKKVAITHKKLINEVDKGTSILLDDGLIELIVEDIKGDDIITTIKNSGVLKANKGINIPGAKISLPALTEKDKSDIIFGIKNNVDFVAASFIRKKKDVIELRKLLDENGGKDIEIISKIENREGLDNLEEIISESYGIMVARGDLGIEIPSEELPFAQKDMIRKANVNGKVVVTATHMLDSMIRNPRPTRAEVTDIANAVLDGTDAIMLSGETASGKYPVEAVKTMARVANKTEETINYDKKTSSIDNRMLIEHDGTYQVCKSSVESANELNAAAILATTATGFTATRLALFRPRCPIIAVTLTKQAKRKMCIHWGIYPILGMEYKSNQELVEFSIQISKKYEYIKEKDLIILTAGLPVGIGLRTNFMKIQEVGEPIFYKK